MARGTIATLDGRTIEVEVAPNADMSMVKRAVEDKEGHQVSPPPSLRRDCGAAPKALAEDALLVSHHFDSYRSGLSSLCRFNETFTFTSPIPLLHRPECRLGDLHNKRETNRRQ